MNYEEYRKLISRKLGIKFEVLNAYKLCDFKPFNYQIHTEILSQYEFWGFGDIDLIFGDLRIILSKLKKYDISSLVEEGSIKDILDTNNWNYASSYKVSRMYLENAKKNNPSLKYFIDIHRDSVNKNISTVRAIYNALEKIITNLLSSATSNTDISVQTFINDKSLVIFLCPIS